MCEIVKVKVMKKKISNIITVGTLVTLMTCLISCGKKVEAVITAEGEDITQAEKTYDTLPASTADKFTYDDLTVGKVRYKMTEQEVKQILGEPVTTYDTNEKSVTDEVINEKVYAYNELTLIFSEIDKQYVLTAAASVDEKDIFARGIHVGDSVDRILEVYYRDSDCMNHTYYTSDKTTVIGKMLYGDYTMDVLDNTKIKDKIQYGMINFNGYTSLEAAESYIVEFTYFEPPYKEEYASVNDDFAQIAFDVDNSGKITAIRWYYYPEV
jgi:hypothetical protein